MRLRSVVLLAAAIYSAPVMGQVGEGCDVAFLEPQAASALNIEQTRLLIDHIERGGQLRVRLSVTPADSDSVGSVFWFEPKSVQIINDQVFAEAGPFHWPVSATTWNDGDPAVVSISFRVSSTGRVSTYQPDVNSTSAVRRVGWCLS